MALPKVLSVPNYNLGTLGANYGTRLDLAYPEAGYYSAAIDVVLGDAYNLQGVQPGAYNWSFANVRPDDPSLVQTTQFLSANSSFPLIYGRRMQTKNGIIATFNAWFHVAQWNGVGAPITG